MGLLRQLLFVATLTVIPNCVEALTWGDFHIFAVIFFSFVGGFMGLGAIFGALYIACGKPFIDRFRDEVNVAYLNCIYAYVVSHHSGSTNS